MSEKIIKVGVVGLGRGTAIARCLKGVKNATFTFSNRPHLKSSF